MSPKNRLWVKLFLAVYFAFAPSEVEPWRVEAKSPPARVLPVGDPVTGLYG